MLSAWSAVVELESCDEVEKVVPIVAPYKVASRETKPEPTVVKTGSLTIGGGTMLAAYASRRRVDRGAGIAFTHGLVRIFGNDVPLARWSRGFALALLDVVPPAKRAFTRAMLHGMH